MKPRTLAVVSAGLSVPSSTRLLADRLAKATTDALSELGVAADTRVIELREHAHEIVNAMLTGFPSGRLKDAVETVAAADGLVAVTPVFNASYSGLFKSFIDVLDDTSLEDTPVLIGATGGTVRHSLVLEHALRPLFVYLRAVVMPTGVYAAPEDWAGAEARGSLRERIDRAASELAQHMKARKKRDKRVTDPFTLKASFEELLGR